MSASKMKSIMALAACATLTTGAAAMADGDRHRAMVDRMFDRMDVNGDDAVDKAEIDGVLDVMFEAADTNADGVVSKAEARAAAQNRAGERAEKRFERLDRNGDGGVDRAEMAAGRKHGRGEGRLGRMLQRLDANGDGRITRQEAYEGAARRHERRGD